MRIFFAFILAILPLRADIDLSDPAFLAAVEAPAAGGGPTLIDSDDFDSYADEDSLHSAADWVDETGVEAFYVEKIGGDGSIRPSGGTGLCRHSATVDADMRVEVTIDAAAAGGSFDLIGPAVRVQSGAVTGYAVVMSGGDLYLLSISAGTATEVVSDTGMSFSAGHRIALEASGAGASTRLKVQIDTGSGWVDKWTDQNPPNDIDGGFGGLGSWLLSGPGNRVDDWKVYDL